MSARLRSSAAITVVVVGALVALVLALDGGSGARAAQPHGVTAGPSLRQMMRRYEATDPLPAGFTVPVRPAQLRQFLAKQRARTPHLMIPNDQGYSCPVASAGSPCSTKPCTVFVQSSSDAVMESAGAVGLAPPPTSTRAPLLAPAPGGGSCAPGSRGRGGGARVAVGSVVTAMQPIARGR